MQAKMDPGVHWIISCTVFKFQCVAVPQNLAVCVCINICLAVIYTWTNNLTLIQTTIIYCLCNEVCLQSELLSLAWTEML